MAQRFSVYIEASAALSLSAVGPIMQHLLIGHAQRERRSVCPTRGPLFPDSSPFFAYLLLDSQDIRRLYVYRMYIWGSRTMARFQDTHLVHTHIIYIEGQGFISAAAATLIDWVSLVRARARDGIIVRKMIQIRNRHFFFLFVYKSEFFVTCIYI